MKTISPNKRFEMQKTADAINNRLGKGSDWALKLHLEVTSKEANLK